jgi:hypothetical protein
VLRIRVPVAFLPLDLGFGIGKKSGSGSGMNNPDHISESFVTIFWVKILEFFNTNPGWKKIRSGMEKMWIRGKRPGSATLFSSMKCRPFHCSFFLFCRLYCQLCEKGFRKESKLQKHFAGTLLP